MVNNRNWDEQWIYTDSIINLLHCDDEHYLRFLVETLHPILRRSVTSTQKLLELSNQHLDKDGHEISPAENISGIPLYKGQPKSLGSSSMPTPA
jgi:hypothetical protein